MNNSRAKSGAYGEKKKIKSLKELKGWKGLGLKIAKRAHWRRRGRREVEVLQQSKKCFLLV